VRKGVDRDRVDDRAERRSPYLSIDEKIDEYRSRARQEGNDARSVLPASTEAEIHDRRQQPQSNGWPEKHRQFGGALTEEDVGNDRILKSTVATC
jgi:hypothetical protein